MEGYRTSVVLNQILQTLDGSNTTVENTTKNVEGYSLLPDEGADTIFRPAGMKKDAFIPDSKFNPETLLVGEVMLIAIIVAAIQSSLIPTFQVDLTSIGHQESAAAVTRDSSTPSSVTKITYPSLIFIDKGRNFHITFSMVPIFGEMVIYAMKKHLIDENIIQSKANTQLSSSAITSSDSQETKKE